MPGMTLTYTVVVTNNGPEAVTSAIVSDTLPGYLIGVTWTCTASAGSQCSISGSGNLSDYINLPSGGAVTYRITGQVAPSTATGTVVSNTASVTAPAGAIDPAPDNNNETHTTAVVPYPGHLPLILR